MTLTSEREASPIAWTAVTPPVVAAVQAGRFWSNVDVRGPDECWLWSGRTRKGYGVLGTGSREKGTQRGYAAHRISYELLVGPIPEGLVIDHLCRTPLCVNPAHMEPVTTAENTRRGLANQPGRPGRPGKRGPVKTHCPQNHPYDEKNTIWRRRGRECRRCRQTARNRAKSAQRARQRAQQAAGPER